MAVVEFLYEDIKKIIDLPKEKIIETLTEIGAPTEEVNGKLIVEVTPNRPDLFFIEGIKRTLESYLEGKIHKYETEKSKYALICDKSVFSVRPFVRAVVIRGVKLDETTLNYLIEAQEKLHETVGRKRKKVAIGIHDLKMVEFPLIYKVVSETKFVPLGYEKELSIQEIVTTHKKGMEYAHLVQNGKYPMIYDNRGVISFPPIINSERTKLNNETSDLLIDVTGTHEETVDGVFNMLVCAFADRGGKIFEVKINGEPYPKLKQKVMKVDLEFFSKTLGIRLKGTEIKKMLERMDYEIKGKSVFVQPYRIDVIDQVDVLEDVAIVYGYNKFEPTLPNFFSSGKLSNKNVELEEVMKSMGFGEITTFTLTSKDKVKDFGLFDEESEVLNAASEEYCVLRPRMIVSLMDVLNINKTKGLPQKIYEVGDIYHKEEIEKSLIFSIIDQNIEFADIRGVLQTLMNEFGVKFKLENSDNNYLEKAESGKIIVNGDVCGSIGVVKKDVLQKFGLEFLVVVCEIRLKHLFG